MKSYTFVKNDISTSMGLYTAIALFIKEQRKKSHLTQQELADKCGLNKSDISKLENEIGNPSMDRLERVFNSFNLNVSEIKTKKVK